MVQTNLAGVALDVFSSSRVTLTREGLEQLPKTLRDIRCNFEPISLEEHVQGAFRQVEVCNCVVVPKQLVFSKPTLRCGRVLWFAFP